MNIRDILANPLLPVMAEIKENKRKFLKERIVFTACIWLSFFFLVFLIRLAWFLPLILLYEV